ncbi:MAG TPA: tripartite tricarboxylate transporter substrate binding protein [Gemmatimonadaceae bacterium]|jgi:putative tricarboxylic transport membrane protein|nr:tripartite tricarboxylate transporter substrate binding protein [Gemmatimonadaceae bacterium]
MRRRTFALGATAAAGLGWLPSSAQEKFPSKPIEVVTHSGAGGGTDITARMMMVHAPGVFGTELVVANRVGGSGAAALAYAAGRPRDGHTILLVTQSHLLTILQGKSAVKYDELVALARATADPQVLMVGKASPIKSAQELVAAGKARKLKVGVTHIGSIDHISLVGFARKAGLQAPTPVPFRGGGDIVVNVVSGNIDLGMLNYAEAESQIKAGDVRPLMVLTSQRLKILADVPTAKELGIDADYATVRGFVTLKGVPDDRLKTLEDGLIKAMKGQMYSTYIETSGQAPDSVAARAEWQAQLDAMYREAETELKALAAAPK